MVGTLSPYSYAEVDEEYRNIQKRADMIEVVVVQCEVEIVVFVVRLVVFIFAVVVSL